MCIPSDLLNYNVSLFVILSKFFLFIKSKKVYMYEAVLTLLLKLLKKILVICDLLTYHSLTYYCVVCNVFPDEDKLIIAMVKIFLL